MDEAWKETGYPELAKRSIDSLIDLWAIDEKLDYRGFSSGHEQDRPNGAFKNTSHFKNWSIHVFMTKELLHSGEISNCPLHALAMCLEHGRVIRCYERCEITDVLFMNSTQRLLSVPHTKKKVNTTFWKISSINNSTHSETALRRKTQVEWRLSYAAFKRCWKAFPSARYCGRRSLEKQSKQA